MYVYNFQKIQHKIQIQTQKERKARDFSMQICSAKQIYPAQQIPKQISNKSSPNPKQIQANLSRLENLSSLTNSQANLQQIFSKSQTNSCKFIQKRKSAQPNKPQAKQIFSKSSIRSSRGYKKGSPHKEGKQECKLSPKLEKYLMSAIILIFILPQRSGHSCFSSISISFYFLLFFFQLTISLLPCISFNL